MNKVILLGNIGQPPTLKYSQQGTAICNLSLATSKKIKGEQKTQWHRLVAFGKTAELIDKYINKGDQLGVEGELSYGSYDKDGTKVYTTDIIVNQIHFVGGKSQENKQQDRVQQGYNSNSPQGYSNQPDSDNDIPF